MLGDDRLPDRVETVNPARGAEDAPVGEERIVDYSRKSRREVQMDLFAREPIMPRAMLRRAHVEEGHDATAITARLGAPFAVVAQQLLDALLLPPVEARPEKKDFFPLNEKQNDAARHRGKAFLLEAGPGTGKTKTLVGRLAGLLDDKVDPREIVVLTYSNKAAAELAARIAEKHPQDAAAMRIGTFHAFCFDLIRRFHKELGYAREPRLLDRSEAIGLMLDEVAALDLDHYRDVYDPTAKLRDLLQAVSRAQDEVVLPPRYAELAVAMKTLGGVDAAAVAKAEEVARVYARYDAVKKAHQRVDFGDLVALPTDLLERHPGLAQQLRGEIAHVLVDEYQDVNRASVRLLQALTDGGRNLWCVGDVRQSIYRFRGASSFNLQRFDTDDFPGGQGDHLEVNYRSGAEIVVAYSAFATDPAMPGAGGRSPTLSAWRGALGHPVEFRVVAGEAEREIDALADAIREMKGQGFAFRDQALLCSGNDRLARIGRGLEARGIPVLYLGSLFERPEVKDVLAWLSLLIDRRAMGLARGSGAAGLTFSLPDVAAISAALGDDAAAPLSWLDTPPNLSPEGQAMIERYRAALAGFDADGNPWDIAARLLLDRTRLAADIAASDAVAERAKGIALWQLLNFLRAEPVGHAGSIGKTLERIRRLVLLSDERDLRQIPAAADGIDAIRLMTMHGSKGLEFPVVHIPGMNLNTLPRAPSTPACPPPLGMIAGTADHGRAVTDREHGEEQQCLFYVALSRARDRLILYAPNQDKRGKKSASPFMERLGRDLRRSTVTPKTCLAPPGPELVPIAFSGAPAFSQSQLALFERCPRRFFYTHMLRLGGRRTTTPYEEMHDVVRQVVDTYLRDPAAPAPDMLLASLWAAAPLSEAPAAPVYKALADRLVATFTRHIGTGATRPGRSLSIALGGAEIRIDIAFERTGPGGASILSQLRTGHSSSTEKLGGVVMALPIALLRGGGRAFGEILFLGDDAAHRFEESDRKLDGRAAKVAGHVEAILGGRFDVKPSSRTCPKCPAFFTCGPLAPGGLEKKFG